MASALSLTPSSPTRTMPRGAPRRRRARRSWSGIWYVLPSAALLLLTSVVPVCMSIGFSFTDYSVLEPGTFTGLDNYSAMLSDPVFLNALRVTVVYAIISVPLQTIGSLVIAEALAKRFRNRFGATLRSVLFIPAIASMVVSGTVWRMILSDSGPVNALLGALGLPPGNWLGEATSALVAVSLITVWANIGYFVVIYYAAILEVPTSLYEASALDGAGPLKQFWHITLPSARPATVIVTVLGTIWSFQSFDLIYVLTGGGPGGATSTLVFAIYRFGFQNFQMGYASAVAVVLLLAVLTLSVLQNRFLKAKD
jgi:multiple sugar transport system permease protein